MTIESRNVFLSRSILMLNVLQLLAVPLALVAGVAGCGQQEDATAAPRLGVDEITAAQTITSTGTAGYDAECSTYGVPMPPLWGTAYIGNGTQGTWKNNGMSNDSFIGNDGGTIYFAQSTSPAGVCVVDAHSTGGGGTLDLICQGSNGNACFWEGNISPVPPTTATRLVPNLLRGGTDLAGGSPPTTPCTTCHAGENAFIAHEAPNNALNLTSVWMPSTGDWMNPLVTAASIQNPMPCTSQFTSYPVSTSNCTGCHVAGVAGRFPQLTKYPSTGYCNILASVTNLPGSQSGMPPTSNCTPNVNCALQTDPFVKAMLATCPPSNGVEVAMASSASPVGISADGSTYFPGSYDHFVADRYLSGSQTTNRGDNRYLNGQFLGWSLNNVSQFVLTSWRASGWVKSATGAGDEYTLAATDNSGTLWEDSRHGRVNVTAEAGWSGTVLGSPVGYVRHDGNNVIVFRGTTDGYSHHIYEAFWDSTRSYWTQIAQLPDQGADGDPVPYARTQSSSVIYKCGTGLCELRLVGSTWYFRPLPNAKPLKLRAEGDGYGSTMPVVDWFQYTSPPEGNVFYTAADGIHVLEDDSEPWFGTVTDVRAVADTTVASSPSIFHNIYPNIDGDQMGRNGIVYRAGSGTAQSIIQLEETAHGSRQWTKSTVYNAKAGETLSDDVASYLSPAPWVNVILFRNTAHNLIEDIFVPATSSYAAVTIY